MGAPCHLPGCTQGWLSRSAAPAAGPFGAPFWPATRSCEEDLPRHNRGYIPAILFSRDDPSCQPSGVDPCNKAGRERRERESPDTTCGKDHRARSASPTRPSGPASAVTRASSASPRRNSDRPLFAPLVSLPKYQQQQRPGVRADGPSLQHAVPPAGTALWGSCESTLHHHSKESEQLLRTVGPHVLTRRRTHHSWTHRRVTWHVRFVLIATCPCSDHLSQTMTPFVRCEEELVELSLGVARLVRTERLTLLK